MKDNKMNNSNDFVKHVLDSTLHDANFRMFMEAIPQMVAELKATYDEMKKQGFDDRKAYDFAKSLMLGTADNN